MKPRLAYYADDFTGATDALESLGLAGVRTVLFTGTPGAAQLARYPDVEAVGIAGCSRALATADLEAELRPALSALRATGAPCVHYKVCSTFDSSPTVGSIGRAIEVGREVFPGDVVPLVVGAPALGRYCVFGHLFARYGIGTAGAIHRLDRHPAMRVHPVTPADESDLRLHLARQTELRLGLLDVLELARPEAETRGALERLAAAGNDVVLFDVLEPAHLARIGALLGPRGTERQPLFVVGSSAVEGAFAAYWRGGDAASRETSAGTWTRPAAGPVLVLSGSCSPVTLGQIRWAVRNGFADLGIEPDADGDAWRRLAERATAEARAGRSVVVHTHPGTSAARERGSVPPARLGRALGELARTVLAATWLRRVLVAGGDTSSYTARALGIEAVEMIAPLAPGAPLCRASAPGSPADGAEVNFKGGQVGAEDYFGQVGLGAVTTISS